MSSRSSRPSGENIDIKISLRDGGTAHIARLSNRNLGSHFDDVVQIEVASFPASIRDSASQLIKLAQSPLALFLLALVQPLDHVVGYLAAERLELFDDVPGVKDDPHFGLGDSVYLSSVAVLEPFRHQGIGIAMERLCLQLAKESSFKRVTAHVVEGSLKPMGLVGRVLGSFPNWYRTGKTYEYVELPLVEAEGSYG